MCVPPLLTSCLRVKLSRVPLSSCRLSAVGCRLSFPPIPLPATLAARVKPKSFICNAYKKHGGVRVGSTFFIPHSTPGTSTTRRNARNSNPTIRLLHNSRTHGVGGTPSSEVKHQLSPPEASSLRSQPKSRPQLSIFNCQLSTSSTSHQSRVTSHLP
jgi:hypothetical protein